MPTLPALLYAPRGHLTLTSLLRTLVLLTLALASGRLFAQPAAGTIAGAVSNASTQLFLDRAEVKVEGTKLVVEYLGEHYPVTVAVAGATPLFDPKNERILS